MAPALYGGRYQVYKEDADFTHHRILTTLVEIICLPILQINNVTINLFTRLFAIEACYFQCIKWIVTFALPLSENGAIFKCSNYKIPVAKKAADLTQQGFG